MLVFQSFTVKTTQTSEAIFKFSALQLFDYTKCLLKPIGVPNVILPADRCAECYLKEGRDIDWRCKYCTNAVDSAISTNGAFTSLAMPVAMSTMIDEASVTGWLSTSCLISSELTYSKCITGSMYYLGDKQGFDVLSVLLFFVSFKSSKNI